MNEENMAHLFEENKEHPGDLFELDIRICSTFEEESSSFTVYPCEEGPSASRCCE